MPANSQDMSIMLELSPSPDDRQAVFDGLRRFNETFVSGKNDISFGVFLRGERSEILGGLLARAGRGWLRISTMWVDPSVRRKGFGKKLMAAAEAEALRHGCRGAFLDTFSFQDRPFYERCGYEVFGTLEDFPEGHQRYFMRKNLLENS